MNEKMYDILESCIQELDNDAEIETVLARYPKLAAELRPVLKAALQAKKMTAPAPSQDAIIRGRARLMQKAAEMREEKIAPRKRAIPFFQRLAISFAVTAALLLSGTGLVGASSTALPGQNLYPVKRGWEDVRLFLTFNEEDRNSLEQEIEEERLHEVDELLSEEEHMLVDFSGVFTSKNGAMYVSDVQVLFPDGAQLPNDGVMLHVVGWTTEKGYVEVTRFEIIQVNFTVPNGTGIESTPVPSPVNEDQTKPADSEENQIATEENLNNNINENESAQNQEGLFHESIATPSEDVNQDGTSTNENDHENDHEEKNTED